MVDGDAAKPKIGAAALPSPVHGFIQTALSEGKCSELQ
jgi:hypothetical protein